MTKKGQHRLSTNATLLPPIVLCEGCRQRVTEMPATLVVHETGSHVRRVISPRDMLAAQAFDKGVNLHMRNGAIFYETLSLKNVLADYPGLFFRAGRDWLVANDAVDKLIDEHPGHTLELTNGLRVAVSRRAWPSVGARFGMRAPARPLTAAQRVGRFGGRPS